MSGALPCLIPPVEAAARTRVCPRNGVTGSGLSCLRTSWTVVSRDIMDRGMNRPGRPSVLPYAVHTGFSELTHAALTVLVRSARTTVPVHTAATGWMHHTRRISAARIVQSSEDARRAADATCVGPKPRRRGACNLRYVVQCMFHHQE